MQRSKYSKNNQLVRIKKNNFTRPEGAIIELARQLKYTLKKFYGSILKVTSVTNKERYSFVFDNKVDKFIVYEFSQINL